MTKCFHLSFWTCQNQLLFIQNKSKTVAFIQNKSNQLLSILKHVKTSCRPSITSQNQLPSILDMSKAIVAIHPEHVHPEQVKTPYLPSWTSHNHFPFVLNKTKPLTFNPQQVKTPLPSILNKSKPLSFLPKQVKITYLPSWTGQNHLLIILNKSKPLSFYPQQIKITYHPSWTSQSP